jgi:D-alanyl-D-alanine carboxypeptidase/D-alanyl-D-alanine-endopeptidase (penicillin-binding protein 4)
MTRRRLVTGAALLAVALTGVGGWAWLNDSPERPRVVSATTTTTEDRRPVRSRPERPTEPRPNRPRCTADPSVTAPPSEPVPTDLTAALAALLADPAIAASAASASVWIEGWGEVVAYEPDRALLPASNEKILTAMGALAVLGPDATTETRLATAGNDLVMIAGGDPTLARTGPHSLDALATQVRAAGITSVNGALVIDESRHDSARVAPGWLDWHVPSYAGPLSAFMVDRNRYRGDPEFVADPALANGEELRAALARQGVTVAGPTIHGEAPVDAVSVASLTSPPVAALVTDMLLRSDNMIAEQLLREVGVAGQGSGSTPAGAAAATHALRDLCVPLTGTAADGSGLSRSNLRSAREWRTILQAARSQPWFPLFSSSLPVGGQSGTLAGRFDGTAAEGNVRAKTGTIIGGVALSGYLTTAGGRDAVFSFIVNGPQSGAADDVIDSIVATVAAHPG